MELAKFEIKSFSDNEFKKDGGKKDFKLPINPETFTRNLNQWAQWTGADYSLGGLAGSLPDEAFASSAHLNSKNVASYTKALAEELKKAGVVPLGD